MDTLKIVAYDPAESLTDEAGIAAYIDECYKFALEDNDPELLIEALRTVARARGMTQLAKDTGLNRQSLYKALGKGANPLYTTVLTIAHALKTNGKAHATV